MSDTDLAATQLILVVDDDPHIVEILEFSLTSAGFAVTTAASGEEALDRFRELDPALVVLDIGLPGRDGLWVCQRMREESQTPILFLSARDEEVDRVMGLTIGGDDYVTKPFSPRELTARARAILRRGGPAAAQAATDSGAASKWRNGRLRLDPESPHRLLGRRGGGVDGHRIPTSENPSGPTQQGLHPRRITGPGLPRHRGQRPNHRQPYPPHPQKIRSQRRQRRHSNLTRSRLQARPRLSAYS